MSDISRTTKEIEEILAPLENSKESAFVLIEGAPGIGKTVLLKEIAYKWDNNELLQKSEFVRLVYLRDPSCSKSYPSMIFSFCSAKETIMQHKLYVSGCAQYLFANGGKTLILLLDGYDEYPRDLQESSLIADILKRQVLPLCGLIVSSRPHASQHLHKQATIRVDILGFTETEREHYIHKHCQINRTK